MMTPIHTLSEKDNPLWLIHLQGKINVCVYICIYANVIHHKWIAGPESKLQFYYYSIPRDLFMYFHSEVSANLISSSRDETCYSIDLPFIYNLARKWWPSYHRISFL